MSVVFVAASKLPTPFGEFTMHGFLDEESGKEHVALSMGDIADGAPVLGRLHSECLTGARCSACAAIAVSSWKARLPPSPRRAAACSSTCARKVAASAC